MFEMMIALFGKANIALDRLTGNDFLSFFQESKES